MTKKKINAPFFDQKVEQLNSIRDAVFALVASQGEPQRLLAAVVALALILATNITAQTLLGMDFKLYGWVVVPIAGALAAYAYHKVSTYNPKLKANADAIYALIDAYTPLNKDAYCHLQGHLSLEREFNVPAVQIWLAAELRTINKVQYPAPEDKTSPQSSVDIFSR